MRLASRLTILGLGLLGLFLGGCAGVNMGPGDAGTNGSGGRTGRDGGVGVGIGGGGGCIGIACNLPIPDGCGDGINNQGGIEQCDDGNTVRGRRLQRHLQVRSRTGPAHRRAPARGPSCAVTASSTRARSATTATRPTATAATSTARTRIGRYTCTPGMRCVSTSVCGNKRVEPGETCDDGNATPATAAAPAASWSTGWVCPAPGSPCTKARALRRRHRPGRPRRGVRRRQHRRRRRLLGRLQGEGRRLLCVPGHEVRLPGGPCGDGTIEGTEKCDDGNANSGDGCSSTCTIETRLRLPAGQGALRPQLRRRHPDRQRAVRSADRRSNMNGLLGDLPLELRAGPARAARSRECHATKCGDGKKEGAEGCDDGNTVPYDGCSATCCQSRAAGCTAGACTGKCGDGIVCPARHCDDGNNLSGDGCSRDCKFESGFTCTQPPLGDSIQVPAVYRDFATTRPSTSSRARSGRRRPSPGLVERPCSTRDGKPVVPGTANHGTSPARPRSPQWYTDVAARQQRDYARTMTLWNNGDGGYVNRWGPNGEQWSVTTKAYYCGNVGREMLDAAGNAIPCTSTTAASPIARRWTRWATRGFVHHRAAATTPPSTRPARSTGRRPSSRSTATPSRRAARAEAANHPAALRADRHLPRDAGTPRTTSASPARSATGSRTTRPRRTSWTSLGDDDVWVFVNKKPGRRHRRHPHAAARDDHHQRRPTRRPSA